MEGGRVLGVARNVKFASVCGNERILSPKSFCWKTEIKLCEDMPKGFRKEFSPLLDEGGSRGDFVGKEIKIFQKFMTDTAAFHAEEEMNQLNKPQLAVASKILTRVFDKLGRVAGHGIHDCPESGFDLLWE